jgi:uncharacterized protein (TIGR02328 family)
MRLWHKDILDVLPELQLRSQWRECVAIAKDLHETGFTHHLLINQVMSYTKDDFNAYCYLVLSAMIKRGIQPKEASCMKLHEYIGFIPNKNLYNFDDLYAGWHNKKYLRVCMANFYEKHFFGVGKSRITDEEWARLCKGYKTITGEDYEI